MNTHCTVYTHRLDTTRQTVTVKRVRGHSDTREHRVLPVTQQQLNHHTSGQRRTEEEQQSSVLYGSGSRTQTGQEVLEQLSLQGVVTSSHIRSNVSAHEVRFDPRGHDVMTWS